MTLWLGNFPCYDPGVVIYERKMFIRLTTDNSHFLCEGKYYCMADLLFQWFGFSSYRKSTCLVEYKHVKERVMLTLIILHLTAKKPAWQCQKPFTVLIQSNRREWDKLSSIWNICYDFRCIECCQNKIFNVLLC